MDELAKQQAEIIKLVESMLNRGDFMSWLKDADNISVELDEPFLMTNLVNPHQCDFDNDLKSVYYFIGQELREVAYHQKKMWATYNRFMSLCESYARGEKEIKQPDLLKFIAGYKNWKKNHENMEAK